MSGLQKLWNIHHELWRNGLVKDRCLATAATSRQLREKLNHTPLLDKVAVTLPAKGTQEARTAILQVRATRATLKAPTRIGVRRPNLEIYSVLAREENPPAG